MAVLHRATPGSHRLEVHLLAVFRAYHKKIVHVVFMAFICNRELLMSRGVMPIQAGEAHAQTDFQILYFVLCFYFFLFCYYSILLYVVMVILYYESTYSTNCHRS